MRKKWLVAGVLCICVVLGGALFLKQQQTRMEERKIAKRVVDKIAPSILAQAYKMPQKDYKKLMQLKNQLLQTQKISNSDLDWLLALLKPTSDYLVHLRIFAMLEFLGNAPSSQKQKILIAITPYLRQNNPRYRNSMKHIQKFVFGNPNWKPGEIPPVQS